MHDTHLAVQEGWILGGFRDLPMALSSDPAGPVARS